MAARMAQPKLARGITKAKPVNTDKATKTKSHNPPVNTGSSSGLGFHTPSNQLSVAGFFTNMNKSWSNSFPALCDTLSQQDQQDQGQDPDIVQDEAAELELEPDLEALVLQEGTHWADSSDKLADQSVEPVEATPTLGRSWVDLVNADRQHYARANLALLSNCDGNDETEQVLVNTWSGMLKHKAEVLPVFIAYKRVSQEGTKISLMQVATAVLKSVVNPTSLDAVQPMRQGWYVYMKINIDCACLVEQGITITGRFIALQSDYRPEAHQSVKVMIKDLPLHSMDNETVLEGLYHMCEVTSLVNYSNLWFKGKVMSIRNGD